MTMRDYHLHRLREALRELHDAVATERTAQHTLEYHRSPAEQSRLSFAVKIALTRAAAALEEVGDE